MRLFSRLTNLVRGLTSRWLGRRERANPGAVYEAAIRERVVQYAKLREAAAGVIYLRGKLERELQGRSGDLGRVRQQLDLAIDRDDDPAALALISRRETLGKDVERLTTDLTELTAEADAAKRNLVAFQDEIVRLREERVRMLARLANAKARLKLHETLSGLSPEADIQALETVREHVSRLVAEVSLVREGADPELERRLGIIRDTEAAAAARAQLEELKRNRRATLVPMTLAPAAAPAAAR
ncbi:MAG TPA: PspA/IM30 family protein [Candidatus Binatia bacterium]|nr:PspA/IM30 family protein [Candidatus Binatia bacterium]